jgi:hypothetical protein
MGKFFVGTCILFVCISNAQAIECRTNVQGGNSRWAWRSIDGRRCWYQGTPGIDKSLLHWPAAADSFDKSEETTKKPEAEKSQETREMLPIPPELLKMLPIMPQQPTFEDRWRLH